MPLVGTSITCSHPGGFDRPGGRAVSPRRSFTALALCLLSLALLPAAANAAGPPVISKTAVKGITTTSATFEATLNPNGAKTTPYHFEYVDQASFKASEFATAKTTPDGPALNGSADQLVSATVAGLEPGTVYHFRLFAHNNPGDSTGEELTFATYSLAPSFGPCPNEALRSGHPSAILPDCRAYEQVSPVDKNGGDVLAIDLFAKASSLGNAALFASTFSAPGGEGAQDLPTFQGLRGPAGWSSFGQLPPLSFGDGARVLGWLPDFSKTFLQATRFGEPNSAVLLERSGDGSPPVQLTPYVDEGSFSYSGASADGSKIVFAADGQLPVEAGGPPIALARPDAKNVYVHDEASGKVSLASVLNTAAQTEAALPKGAFSGSYGWSAGTTPEGLSQGGGYEQAMRSVSAAGSVFFTAAGSGQLYERVNPTEPQSALDGEGHCTEPAKACTFHLSASHRTPPDPAGAAPAAFQGASADGTAAFFTSPEKLTSDANTGPDQPAPKIGRSNIDGETEFQPSWLPQRAVGVAVDGEHIYWANPRDGTIGRAEIGGGNPEPDFITPGPTTVEEETEPESGEFETLEFASHPRYVAVDAGHIYWTNAADGGNGHGSIGRADLDGTPASVEPECVSGASNPQGIAVNATHMYWANSGNGNHRFIGRAEIDCGGAMQDFQQMELTSDAPYGVAVSASKIYWIAEEDNSGNSTLKRVPLSGGVSSAGVESKFFSATAKPRGLTLVGEDLYWAAQGEEAIGHAVWPDANEKPTTLEKQFIELEGGPSGIAIDSEHLYWSTDGESEPNLGNDLYRFQLPGSGSCAQPAGCLEDITPDAADPYGVEVQGVLGTSSDGSRVYFAANGDLDGGGSAQPGTCIGPPKNAKGQCNVYLWEAGTVHFIDRIDASGAANWAPIPGLTSGSQKTSFLSADGRTLLLGTGELYRDGEPAACVTCDPTSGRAVAGSLDTMVSLPALTPSQPAALQSRMLSADGNRVYFETTAAMVVADTDAAGGCPTTGSESQAFPACVDVYEWEAPGSGSCTVGGPAYSPLNSGCLYLLSPGDSAKPALFSDASASGEDVFLFTTERLVGQDRDDLFDLYDARTLGGLASQSPAASLPCEGEGCKPGATPPPVLPGAATSSFQGPDDPKPKRKAHKKKHKHKKHHGRKHKKHRHSKQTGRTR
jgi:hypothetical protein